LAAATRAYGDKDIWAAHRFKLCREEMQKEKNTSIMQANPETIWEKPGKEYIKAETT